MGFFKRMKQEILCAYCNEATTGVGPHFNCSYLHELGISNKIKITAMETTVDDVKIMEIARAAVHLYFGLSKFKEIADKVVPPYWDKEAKAILDEEKREKERDFKILKKEGLV